MDDDLLFRPVAELAALVRGGEVTARELAETSLRRIEALQPELNAFVEVDADGALAAADAVGAGDVRPFAGVPVAIKANTAVKGLLQNLGSRFLADHRPDHDAFLVRRLREAGFVVMGMTNLPEFGILPTTEPRHTGVTRNPWDRERTPGGSSGGAAAAVAAGMVPFAHANDGGGSTRIPAACCGLVGLKPQRGRISLAPDLGEQFLVQDGVLTRTVRETAMLLDLLAGPELGDSSWAPPPAEPFAATAGRAPERLRIALTTTSPIPDVPLDPEGAAAVARTGELLRGLGHEVEEVEAPWQGAEQLSLFIASFGPAVATQIALAELLAGRELAEEEMEPLSWWVWQTCKGIDSIQAQLAAFQLQAAARAVVGWTSGWDAVVTPALAEAPVPLGTIDPQAPDPEATFRRSGTFTPYTAQFNVTGQPAVSLPLFEREDGLPLAVQVVGRPAQEGVLLALAAQLEQAEPWTGRRAPVGAA